MIRRVRRFLATLELNAVDADVARYYVRDGQLSEQPLDRAINDPGRLDLRRRRLAAVRRLEAAGGHDPHGVLTRPPSRAQVEAWLNREVRSSRAELDRVRRQG